MKNNSIKILLVYILVISIITTPINVLMIQLELPKIFIKSDSKLNKVKTSQLNYANPWPVNGKEICNETDTQSSPQICSDEAGGAIITWKDERNEKSGDIYAQKVDLLGNIIWMLNGIAICTENNVQGSPQICSDNQSGAIITWNDKRNDLDYDIYAQKINSSGHIMWLANGSEISTEVEDQSVPQICGDGTGGAIIVWSDFRNGVHYDIYIQKINSTGDVEWTINGTEICIEEGNQIFPQICSDGLGGAIVTWEDSRGVNTDIYAQKINSTGKVQWTSNGVPICTANNTQWYPQICSDGAGGAIITWEDSRSIGTDIYAQRINSDGVISWKANGTEICTVGKDQKEPQICSDGAEGAIITWKDSRTDLFYDIYAQKINSTGFIQWSNDGVAVCNINDVIQDALQICSDRAEGAIITWEDYRNIWADIYAQRIDSEGIAKWAINGTIICNESFNQKFPQICESENGGAIIVWSDFRNGVNYDIYAYFIHTPSIREDGALNIIMLIIILATIAGVATVVIITPIFLKRYRKINK